MLFLSEISVNVTKSNILVTFIRDRKYNKKTRIRLEAAFYYSIFCQKRSSADRQIMEMH